MTDEYFDREYPKRPKFTCESGLKDANILEVISENSK